MQNIQLLLELTAENKIKFRELVKKYHPDRGGDTETAKRIINAKDSDEAVESLYRELILGKTEQEKPKQTEQEPFGSSSPKDAPFGSSWTWKDSERWKDRFSSKEERDEWHEKVKAKREKRERKERRRQRR